VRVDTVWGGVLVREGGTWSERAGLERGESVVRFTVREVSRSMRVHVVGKGKEGIKKPALPRPR
jgi:hypothetical protein